MNSPLSRIATYDGQFHFSLFHLLVDQLQDAIELTLSEYFSADYFTARDRFRNAAAVLDAEVLSYPLEEHPHLTIDVAVLGDKTASDATVISSGVHGVEGYFGSAAQLAWLKSDELLRIASGQRVVLIHAINPFGFAHQRRGNEDNVDLNRNFLSDTSGYDGAPVQYVALDSLLNPKSPPSRWEPFTIKALATIARLGMSAVKQAVAGGQYAYPHGLFFGGRQPSQSALIIQRDLRCWIGDATNVIHVDLHTGLGKFGQCKLLLSQAVVDPWYVSVFGSECVEALTEGDGTAYDSQGALGGWCLSEFSDLNYRFVLAEFGTYGPIRVLAALRAENRAHFYCERDDARRSQAKSELVKCFCPEQPAWQSMVLRKATEVIRQASMARWEQSK